ncbi:MAG: bestrophin family ion channel [Cyclobacteriaceae bacterium]
MIIKRNFSPTKIWQYIKKPMTFVILWSTLVCVVFNLTGTQALVVNFTPIGVLGSALAIFIAFRNNAAYSRWWEARQIWGGVVNSSRVLCRLIITFVDSHAHQENYEKERSEQFKSRLVHQCIAWPIALRLHLRNQESWEELMPHLQNEAYVELQEKQNKPLHLQMQIGRQIYQAMANGTLGGFDSFQMEGQLLALATYQGAAEKIKSTPMPRQYDFFTRVFVVLFSLLLPFGLLSLFQSETARPYSWLVIVFSILIAGVFIIMERTGAALEDPFENSITDVAMTSLCNTIERDLREALGETQLPEKLQPINGYLF